MYLLVDIGGTTTRLAWSDNDRTLRDLTTFPTPGTADEGLAQLRQYASAGTAHTPLAALVIGIPGIINREQGQLTTSPNLPGWVNKPLAQPLAQAIGTPVSLLNDAVAAGLGEAVFGAGLSHRIVAYLTVSTGIGGARITNGRADETATGFEPGHMILDASGNLCPACQKPTTLEALSGGASLERRHQQLPQDIKDQRVWEEAAYHLALGLNNIIMLWSPHVIILGGSMMRDISPARIAHHLASILTIKQSIPPIVPAALPNDERALYGALAYLQHQQPQ